MSIILLASLVFLLMPIFLLLYIRSYNRHKKNHFVEKENMRQKFESEILKTHIEVQEQTMQTIATELHDNIGQLLSLTTLTLNSINIPENEKAAEKIGNSLSLINKSIKEIRELAKILHGEQIVESGIGNAIEQEINWLKRAGAYDLHVNNDLLGLNISSSDKDLIILRLLQEIINNIIKHAQATSIQIDAYLKNEILFLTVKENGIGFDYEEAKNKKAGIGLASIQKRVELIKGKIDVNSASEKGTSIFIEIPYP
ncbi:sensor histidine kinase [Pedobacter rhodius]|uniref:Oxygen sensor histidine kinase NreB n=1 Tax=Pedobacter rhodius TaxID=3004098 RepID=A0ABT4KXQ9_9SPHI|nr:ATP-binding protein [Pedobacter sp. SJ11]MCZ4223699.1 histidine kinase [Pedobacter sp. SJ11]